jgi:hypothetical protein
MEEAINEPGWCSLEHQPGLLAALADRCIRCAYASAPAVAKQVHNLSSLFEEGSSGGLYPAEASTGQRDFRRRK